MAFIFIRLEAYGAYLMALSTTLFTFNNIPPTPTLSIIDLSLLIGSTLSVLFLVYQQRRVKKAKNSYQKLRLDIMISMDSAFCHHSKLCDCKDSYIADMNQYYDIDLVFK